MKLFLLGLILSSAAHSVTLEKSLSLPEGTMRQAIELDKKGLKLFKDSNYFDVEKSYAIGNFTAPSKGHDASLRELHEVLKKVEAVDEALRKRGTSFNEISTPKGHVTIYRLNDYVVGPGSKYYKVLDDQFKKLSTLKWKQVDGYEISRDLKTVQEFEGGKVKKKSEYAPDFYCKQDVCTFVGGGKVFK